MQDDVERRRAVCPEGKRDVHRVALLRRKRVGCRDFDTRCREGVDGLCRPVVGEDGVFDREVDDCGNTHVERTRGVLDAVGKLERGCGLRGALGDGRSERACFFEVEGIDGNRAALIDGIGAAVENGREFQACRGRDGDVHFGDTVRIEDEFQRAVHRGSGRCARRTERDRTRCEGEERRAHFLYFARKGDLGSFRHILPCGNGEGDGDELVLIGRGDGIALLTESERHGAVAVLRVGTREHGLVGIVLDAGDDDVGGIVLPETELCHRILGRASEGKFDILVTRGKQLRRRPCLGDEREALFAVRGVGVGAVCVDGERCISRAAVFEGVRRDVARDGLFVRAAVGGDVVAVDAVEEGALVRHARIEDELRGGVFGLAELKGSDGLFVSVFVPDVIGFLRERIPGSPLQGAALHVPDAALGDDALEGSAVEGGEDELLGRLIGGRVVAGGGIGCVAHLDLIVGIVSLYDFPVSHGICPCGIVVIGTVLFQLKGRAFAVRRIGGGDPAAVVELLFCRLGGGNRFATVVADAVAVRIDVLGAGVTGLFGIGAGCKDARKREACGKSQGNKKFSRFFHGDLLFEVPLPHEAGGGAKCVSCGTGGRILPDKRRWHR